MSKGCKGYYGLRPDDVMTLLYNRIGQFLNTCETEEALKTIQEYRQIVQAPNRYSEMDYGIDMMEIEGYRRLGNNDKALILCNELLKKNLTSQQKVETLIAKGSIESSNSHWTFGVNTLSLALAEAEANVSPLFIAKCYLELASMIGTHYPALSLSFLWKARVHYEKENDVENAAFCKSRMAMAYFLLWHRCQQKQVRFIEEARRLVNEDIKREDFRHQGAQYSFDRLKGLVTNDLNLIETTIDFFESIKAYADFFQSVEFYIKTALAIGDREAAKRCARRYEIVAQSLNDQFRLNYIKSIDFDEAEACWVPEQQHKMLPNLLDVLEMIAYDEERFHLEKSVIRSLFPTHYQEGQFETVEMSDGKTRLFPCTLYPNRYFRGQSDTLEGKKCQPSLFRGLSESETFHERLCLEELGLLLKDYPLTRIFEEQLAYTTPEGPKPLRLNVDVKALGQHYGIKTDVLDLTADKWVAAFFASTDYKNGEYLLHKKEGNGVIYIYSEMPSITEDMSRLSAVGLQPFSRPGCQAGLVYRMLPNEDFNNKAQRIVFKHDSAIEEFIYNYCNRSKKLFPNEILEEKVNAIKASKICSKTALNNVVKEHYQERTKDEISRWLDELDITVQENLPVVFSDEELRKCEEEWEKKCSHYFDSVYVRLSCIANDKT